MKKFLLTTILFFTLSPIIFAQSGSSKGQEFLKYFQGTFASTPNDNLWIKITIKNNNATLWTAMGNSGEWGTPKTCQIQEQFDGAIVGVDRNNDGTKYYSIKVKGCDDYTYWVNYCPSYTYGKYTYTMGAGAAVLSKVNPNYKPWD